ncbi:IPT/TIG domain-containing protein [Allomuricauda sp. NBRC 101325]|uniref:IPT/TIG domain-containing protein n=1 Tax=Allomuricauda sp. NBRC 101325 TaxID=1113758 RepID=UPI0024A23451|nr:IPT/TIG domain-containing protein [Muricauda sp. NBRC 101325]GLU43120.1 hypothetical protein Musp01_07440 [Muricauda sp. NBRC 101325]
MKRLLLNAFCILTACLLIVSCGKDEDPTPVAAGPKISGFNPTSGPIGTEITIKGDNFGATSAENIVKIGSATATIKSASTTVIVATVPTGATSGKVSVTVDGKSDEGDTFTVTEETGKASITLNKSTFDLFSLDSETITVTLTGDVSAQDIVWSSDDESVVIVDENGIITGVSEGSAHVTAYISEEVSTNCIVNVSPSVFAVGYEEINGIPVAKIWKNGVATNLTDGSSFGAASSVYVDGTDIYSCGIVDNGLPAAVVWKNGDILYELTDGSKYANAQSINMYNGDIYVIGNEELGVDNISNATIWKNGVSYATLTDGLNANERSAGEDIFVNETGIYAVGYEESDLQVNGTPKLWENSTQINLTDEAFEGQAYSVIAAGSDVFVAGYEENDNGIWTAKYWKNEEVTILSDGINSAEARSIFVVGEDIYVAGSYYDGQGELQQAVVWKNGIPTNQGDIGSGASSLFVDGGDVYVGGLISEGEMSRATIWKNGETMNLELTEGAGSSVVFSIFIK